MKALVKDHPDVANDLNILAELYRAQGRYSEAELLYKWTLRIVEKTLGPKHTNVVTSLNNVAELYRVQGRYVKAEPFYKRGLAIRKRTHLRQFKKIEFNEIKNLGDRNLAMALRHTHRLNPRRYFHTCSQKGLICTPHKVHTDEIVLSI